VLNPTRGPTPPDPSTGADMRCVRVDLCTGAAGEACFLILPLRLARPLLFPLSPHYAHSLPRSGLMAQLDGAQ